MKKTKRKQRKKFRKMAVSKEPADEFKRMLAVAMQHICIRIGEIADSEDLTIAWKKLQPELKRAEILDEAFTHFSVCPKCKAKMLPTTRFSSRIYLITIICLMQFGFITKGNLRVPPVDFFMMELDDNFYLTADLKCTNTECGHEVEGPDPPDRKDLSLLKFSGIVQ